MDAAADIDARRAWGSPSGVPEAAEAEGRLLAVALAAVYIIAEAELDPEDVDEPRVREELEEFEEGPAVLVPEVELGFIEDKFVVDPAAASAAATVRVVAGARAGALE